MCYCSAGETGLCLGSVVVCKANAEEAAIAKSWLGVEWFEPVFDNGEDKGDPDGVVTACIGDKLRCTFSNELWPGELWTLEAKSA